MKKSLPGILNGIAAIAVFFISNFYKSSFIMSDIINLKILGLVIVYLGIVIIIWATWYLKKGIVGRIEPENEYLVRSGPYKYIRHPIYLGMTIALLGIPIILESCIGIIAVFIFFLPSEIYRAKLEEKSLSKKFGKQWDEYLKRSGFFFPFIKK